MPRLSKSFLTLIAVSVLLVCSVRTNAESFLINSGSVTAGRSAIFNSFTLNIAGASSAMSARVSTFGGSIAAANQCFTSGPCIPGTSVSLGSNTGPLGPTDFLSGGTVVLNGSKYFIATETFPPPGFLALSGSLLFSAGSVNIPITDDPTITLTAPFTMSGGFGGHNESGTFSFDFTGSGIATLVLDRAGTDRGNPTYTFRSLTYAFSPTSIPEPVTIVLLGTGLVGVGIKARKRRR
jgi:hypothetical protein